VSDKTARASYQYSRLAHELLSLKLK
jgi:hypothetical protein